MLAYVMLNYIRSINGTSSPSAVMRSW